eukprot:COSAG01_NODE_5484_length_4230_cov_12.160252_3_plen_153_part_00
MSQCSTRTRTAIPATAVRYMGSRGAAILLLLLRAARIAAAGRLPAQWLLARAATSHRSVPLGCSCTYGRSREQRQAVQRKKETGRGAERARRQWGAAARCGLSGGRGSGVASRTMVLLDVDSFLLRLQRMYQAKKAGGSVWLTFKRGARQPN